MLYKNGGNENSPSSLNLMVNYHYHVKNRIITSNFPYMVVCLEYVCHVCDLVFIHVHKLPVWVSRGVLIIPIFDIKVLLESEEISSGTD